MASGDRRIDELPAAASIQNDDLFAVQQNGEPKNLSGQVLVSELLKKLDGHGGIQSWELTRTEGLKDIYTVTFADGSSTSIVVTNGEKGDKGDASYVWIRYASQEPTEESHNMSSTPDDWIGIYTGFSSTAPTDWKAYTWSRHTGKQGESIKGDPGETPQLRIGNVTTIPHDEPASVSISGTKENPVLNFRIPSGRDGADGEYSANWEVNNSKDPGYVLSRTHYVESPEHYQFGGDVVFSVSNQATLSVNVEQGLEYGVTYKIKFDGQTYFSRCQDIIAVWGAHAPAVGNLYLLDRAFEDTGEPFVMYAITTDGTFNIRTADTRNDAVTILVYKAEVVEKLDNKFLQSDWTATVNRTGIAGPILDWKLAFTTGSHLLNKMAIAGLVQGGRYTVNWGGTEYECTCYGDSDGGLLLGRGALAGSNVVGQADVPFCVASYGGTSVLVFKDTEAAETIAVKIVGHRDYSWEKLPSEFLPDVVSEFPVVVVSMKSMDESTGKIVVSHTSEEIAAKIVAGKLVFLTVGGMLFIPTGGTTDTGEDMFVSFALVLNPTVTCTVNRSGVFTLGAS